MGVLTFALGLGAVVVAPHASRSAALVQTSASGFSRVEKVTRAHLIDGHSQVVDTRTFSLHVGQTRDLRDRQEINVSWKGAHPTGGIVADDNSALAAQQEYPVVLMMCRGLASGGTAASRISPRTCWTQTPAERFQFSTSNFPAYRLDRYASAGDRALAVGEPSPYPKACAQSPGADHWVPFVAANGKVYAGGPNLGCAGIPPEAANASSSLQPGNTTYAVSNRHGKGSAKFVITTTESNASLGCSETVPCSLVVVPIMGISCDPSATSLPPADRPPSGAPRDQALATCSETGAYKPGELSSGLPETEDLPVSGELWWSASNWRNRITVPLTFAPPSNVCSLVNKSAPTDIYGSYLMLQATQQWSPYFCLNPKLFTLQHVQTGEPEAKNLLETGSIDAAFQGNAPPAGFTKPVVQAPTAITGFAIVFAVDNAKGHEVTALRLDARLLAKLLTESYPSNSTLQSEDKALWNPSTHKPNPLDLATDPEFRALNPGMPTNVSTSEAAATLMSISSDSDVIWALTSYINADPEARAWLNGKPDPWGMVVNPAYKGIKLPVTQFPLLDTFESPGLDDATHNPCLASNPTPWLPQVAAPVENPATITLDLQFDIANSQIVCSNAGSPAQKLASIGRETPGQRFILGITSLGDARRYQLNTAALETQGGSTSSSQFTSAAGRSFVAPGTSSLAAAAAMLHGDAAIGSWRVPYAKLRKKPAGVSAYPGTMLVSTDVATTGLAATAAADYAQFLNFAATSGQVPGLGSGELPPGYLPMTAAAGLGKLVAYTKRAAVAVASQTGHVPSLHGTGTTSQPQPTPSGGNSPGSSGTPPAGSNGAGTTGDGSTVPNVKSPGGGGGSPSVAGSPSSSPNNLGAARPTAAVHSTIPGLVFPLVLLLAILAGVATIAFWRLDRPPPPEPVTASA